MKIQDTKLNIGDVVYVLYMNEIRTCEITGINISINNIGITISYNIQSTGSKYFYSSYKESEINKYFFTSKKKLLMEKFGDCFEEKQCLK